MDSARTPGPWQIGFIELEGSVPTGDYTVVATPSWNCLADVHGNEANARLMAAAPDMLEQLQRCRTWLAKVAGDHDGDEIGRAAEKERQRLLGVIAKAEGGN